MNDSEKLSTYPIKSPWYFSTPLICILFAAWFVYGIPVLLGILLLVAKTKYEKKMAAQVQNQIQDLSKRYADAQALLTPEMQDAHNLQLLVTSLHAEEFSANKHLSDIKSEAQEALLKKQNDLNAIEKQIAEKKKELICMDEEVLVQEFGLYTPQYDFASALDYKEELAKIRQDQKDLIKAKKAVLGNTEWTVNNSKTQGRKMVSDTQKLLLRAFNTECDDLINRVKYNNFDATLDKIYKSAETITKLGSVMKISISRSYLDAKVKELRLAFEYREKKQEEKEEQKAARAEQREQAKIEREIEEQRKKVEKEQTHYQTAYEKLKLQLEQNPENADLLTKKEQLESHLADVDKALSDIDYRQANMRAGYVYVISNIGAFGKDVYKIGMTRRLDPQDRIDELGSASVPFNFDVHAMIFSDDAPALEAALHRAFENKKLNLVNQRREFFHVTLDEIKEVVRKNFDKTVEFIDVPDAEQYRISQKMRSEMS
ncbi:DUF4041 domain-containing protein [Brotaphodocola sp.]|uniref:DUF4041 domain-containing protein n=1 Tax=Brotaphodocola sp. TaxID=3073577 RepID=UPI003D7C39A1